jgi:hypothetical protein
MMHVSEKHQVTWISLHSPSRFIDRLVAVEEETILSFAREHCPPPQKKKNDEEFIVFWVTDCAEDGTSLVCRSVVLVRANGRFCFIIFCWDRTLSWRVPDEAKNTSFEGRRGYSMGYINRSWWHKIISSSHNNMKRKQLISQVRMETSMQGIGVTCRSFPSLT